ncbi:MAG: hypothetical protein KGH88_10035, partial [Thaumarchaeota archaeon]|nr:hypothetical protein [Nitrososphaerota archaeon]
MESKRWIIIIFSCIFAVVLSYAGYVNFPLAFADETYSFVTKWGSFGDHNGMFDLPVSIALDSIGNVYVTDTNNNRIEKFSNDGKFLTEWGTYGSGNGQFNLPTDVAI